MDELFKMVLQETRNAKDDRHPTKSQKVNTQQIEKK